MGLDAGEGLVNEVRLVLDHHHQRQQRRHIRRRRIHALPEKFRLSIERRVEMAAVPVLCRALRRPHRDSAIVGSARDCSRMLSCLHQLSDQTSHSILLAHAILHQGVPMRSCSPSARLSVLGPQPLLG